MIDPRSDMLPIIWANGRVRVRWIGPPPKLTLVANCLPPLGTHDFMRLTSVEEWGFCEFATSVNICVTSRKVAMDGRNRHR
jgi:hypothetical protein